MSDTMTDRPGIPNSGEVTIGSGDATSNTVLNTRDDAVFEANQIIIEYDPAGGATNVQVSIHDDADGTSAGNLNAALKTIENLDPGDIRSYNELMMRDFQEDVIVNPDGSHDNDVHVYVDGKIITDAAIVDSG